MRTPLLYLARSLGAAFGARLSEAGMPAAHRLVQVPRRLQCGAGARPGAAAERGVVAVSSGNHAQGVAEAARLFGVRATIVMPSDAPRAEAAAHRAERRARRRLRPGDRGPRRGGRARRGRGEAAPSSIPSTTRIVIAGQGTVGLEIAEDCAALGLVPDVVLVPCSGGGLAAGVTLAVTEALS